MRAGMLRTLVTLQAPAVGVDAIGQPVTGWTNVADVYADIRHQSGMSAIKATADVSVNRVSIRIRYRAVTADMRVLQGATVFAIQAVLPDAKRVFVDLVCQAVA